MLTCAYSNLLVCTDGSDFSAGALREGIRIAKECGARLTILSVIDFNPEFEALAPDLTERMEEEAAKIVRAGQAMAERESVPCDGLLRRGEAPYLEIADEALRRKADLVVMGRRGRTGLKRLLMGSVTKRVIGHAPCNILVVPKAAQILNRNVLVATDGSTFSRAAAAEAIGIAKTYGSMLYVISVVRAESREPFDIVSSHMPKDMVAGHEATTAEANVREVRDLAEKSGVTAHGILLGGNIADVIVETSNAKNIDLVVLGSHGRTGVERLLMGSVAERVVGSVACATLVVKAKP